MKELEKKIEDAALQESLKYPYISKEREVSIKCFKLGALSPEAKEYWQQGMYSEEEIKELLENFKVTIAFAKDFHLSCDIVELFEQNKKKS